MTKPLFFSLQFLILLNFNFCLSSKKQKKLVGVLSLSTNTLVHKIEKKYDESYFDLKGIVLDEYLKFYSSFVSSEYQTWLETVSITIVPIDCNLEIDQILKRIKKLNGLLLTGGAQSFIQRTKRGEMPSQYLTKVKKIVEFVKKINEEERVFPLWATCLGFEALLISESNFKLQRQKISQHNKVIVPININNYRTESAQFFTKNELKEIQTQNLFYFHHSWSLGQKDFKNIPELDEYKIVANFIINHKKYVAWVEHSKYPIYATQFHPEKMANWNKNPQKENQFLRFYINQKLALLFKKHLTKFHGNYKKLEQEMHIVNIYNIGIYKKLIVIDSLDK